MIFFLLIASVFICNKIEMRFSALTKVEKFIFHYKLMTNFIPRIKYLGLH